MGTTSRYNTEKKIEKAMKQTKLEYRMYGLVPYNISPIQQGIQFGHAVVEYGLNHYSYTEQKGSNPYSQWAHYDKTFIILNGGTTSTNPKSPGTLNYAESELYSMGVELSTFHEPDLGDQLTAVVFLVDERVWDKEKYPDYINRLDGKDPIPGTDWHPDIMDMSPSVYYDYLFDKDATWILEMREFLSKYKLA